MTSGAFTVWLTGPDVRALGPLADALATRLAARRLPVEVLGERTRDIDALAGPELERRVAFVAGTLARHGVVTVVAVPSPSRAARERARSELGRLIEVYAHPTAEPRPGYEPPERPEVEIVLPEPSSGVGVERTLHTLEVLGFLARGDQAYSADEEREVIRRLKAFGYI
jgi:hypothetical protein